MRTAFAINITELFEVFLLVQECLLDNSSDGDILLEESHIEHVVDMARLDIAELDMLEDLRRRVGSNLHFFFI